jgi:hypothetical protein
MSLTAITNDAIQNINEQDKCLFNIDIYNDNFKDYFTNKYYIYNDLIEYICILNQLNKSILINTSKKCIYKIINTIKTQINIIYKLYLLEYKDNEDSNDILQNLNATDKDLKETLIIFEKILLNYIN